MAGRLGSMVWPNISIIEQHNMPTGQQIATRAQELKLVFLGLTMTLPLLLHPAVPLLHWHLTEFGVEPGGDIPIDLQHGSEKEVLSYSASEALTKLATLQGGIVGHDLMSISMMHGATRLGDLIDLGGHRRSDEPILEFAPLLPQRLRSR